MIEPLGLGDRARWRETRDPSGSMPRHAMGFAASVTALRCDGGERRQQRHPDSNRRPPLSFEAVSEVGGDALAGPSRRKRVIPEPLNRRPHSTGYCALVLGTF